MTKSVVRLDLGKQGWVPGSPTLKADSLALGHQNSVKRRTWKCVLLVNVRVFFRKDAGGLMKKE